MNTSDVLVKDKRTGEIFPVSAPRASHMCTMYSDIYEAATPEDMEGRRSVGMAERLNTRSADEPKEEKKEKKKAKK